MRLKDKVAIVTGGASGIGKATAELFLKEGAKVTIADISDEGEDVAKRLNCFFVKTDVREEKDVKGMIKKTVEKFGKIDILVNHAGIGENIIIENLSKEKWDDILNTNLRGIFFGIKHVIPFMKKNGGTIVNTSSETAFVGDVGWSAYSSSKGGIVSLTRVAAMELLKYKIRVNAICPGPTKTPLLMEGLDENELKRIEKLVPLGRLGNPEEIAKGILFLSSDDLRVDVVLCLLIISKSSCKNLT